MACSQCLLALYSTAVDSSQCAVLSLVSPSASTLMTIGHLAGISPTKLEASWWPDI